MKPENIMNELNQLANCVKNSAFDRAHSLSQTLFNTLLKFVYAQVRGQASVAVMRALLDLEIEIGGEKGDFRAFDNRQMIDLFIRGNVTGHMEKRTGACPTLSTAMDLHALERWFEAGSNGRPSPDPESLRFIHAWLRLFAIETGALAFDEDRFVVHRGLMNTTEKTPARFPDVGKPYTEPVTGMRLVFIPGNTFSMGDTFDEGVEDEKPVHAVTLSDYYMTDCPVTQAQWKALMADNPSSFAGDDHPVEQVTLIDVQAFLDKLNAASESGLHFDLPSEAQWEYAARSGGKDELYAGGPDPEAVACYEGNSSGGTDPVGGKAPNGLGLYDMSGNVWEWCRDIYHPEAYRRHEKKDPVCIQGGTDRVIRGGSWHLDAWSARCSRRFRFDPDLFGPALGFRVVMVIDG
jgi:formylglycine-generating enzyme required for sulfatase activity